MALDQLSLFIYYAGISLGSLSLGYLVLRLTVPEVRVRTEEEKLGASAVLGAVISLTAMVLDGSLFGWGQFAIAQGFTIPLMVVTTFATFLLFKAYVVMFPPQFLTVGVPLPKSALPPMEAAKKEEKEMEMPTFEKL